MGAIVAWAVLRDDEFEIEIVSINFQFENFVSQSIQEGFGAICRTINRS